MRVLTVSLRSVLQTEGEREGGVIFEELGRESVPPKVVAVLKHRRTRERLARCVCGTPRISRSRRVCPSCLNAHLLSRLFSPRENSE